MIRKCSYCETKDATWMYAPGDMYACDDCVPRGCSCNVVPKDGNWENTDNDNWEQATDEQGRMLPCIEWFSYGEE
jgi:hypothetical protein